MKDIDDGNLSNVLKELMEKLKIYINMKHPNNIEASKDEYLCEIYTELNKFKNKIMKDYELNPEEYQTTQNGSKNILRYDSQIIEKLNKLKCTWDFITNNHDDFTKLKIRKYNFFIFGRFYESILLQLHTFYFIERDCC